MPRNVHTIKIILSILQVVFQEKNARNRCVVYDSKLNVVDIGISLCLLWMESVILSALKTTLLHVTGYGAWLSNLYLGAFCYFFI